MSANKRLEVRELRQSSEAREAQLRICLKDYVVVYNNAPQDKKCDTSQNLLDLQRIQEIRIQKIVSEGSLMFKHMSHKV